MKRKHLAALGTSLALIAALTACSSGDAEEPTTENEDTTSSDTAAEEGGLSNEAGDSAEEESPAEEGSDGASAGSSEVEIVVDGENVVLENPQVQCGENNGTFAIAVTADNLDAESGDAFGALLTTDENPTVNSVALSRSEGVSVAYTEGLDGSADVTVDGKTYTISGSALGLDLNDPTSTDNVDFSFTVTCP
ncbi:lipoprotein LpqH [Gulosibacter chungangensis]|uniref:Lipoprotein LpqH n=1 Tax=Gulosibacter chungangensis TaxID=979746 RepID=A0A7J5B7T1_9MICO|nr:lipoprotein LpqH [Gulosibacter chungangensis]KAB1641183.1 lipoprotein LpqH [Gulosibacter chungangensis]